jgi:quinol monooxygenase YgiN
MSAKLHIIARVIALPDRIEETQELMIGLLEPTRQESGCIRYDLFQNQADPREFTFLEEWTDQAALDAHLASPHLQAAFAKIPTLLSTEPVISIYHPLP